MDMAFPPVWSPESRILILGTFPSPLSRSTGFYYGNPRNRFWPLLAALLKSGLPETVEEKTQLLVSNRIALWDVLASCDIIGARDNSIANPVPNDLSELLASSRISHIYANGAKAGQLYLACQGKGVKLPFKKLPSTSPANAQYSFKRLMEEWQCIMES